MWARLRKLFFHSIVSSQKDNMFMYYSIIFSALFSSFQVHLHEASQDGRAVLPSPFALRPAPQAGALPWRGATGAPLRGGAGAEPGDGAAQGRRGRVRRGPGGGAPILRQARRRRRGPLGRRRSAAAARLPGSSGVRRIQST